jgi:hypothetical protein
MALVPGGGSAGFRALHDGAAIGRAELPPTSPTAFVQADLKKWKLLRHPYRLSMLLRAGSSVNKKGFEITND